MKNLTFILLVLLSGCAQCGREVELNITGYAEVCIHGVRYYQFKSGAFVGYEKDGKIKTC